MRGVEGGSETVAAHGLDIVAEPGEQILCPCDGVIYREAIPYRNDSILRGVAMRGPPGFEIKIFYVEGFVLGSVSAGQPIGYAQNLKVKYPGITNHVHLEVHVDGSPVDPAMLFNQSF